MTIADAQMSHQGQSRARMLTLGIVVLFIGACVGFFARAWTEDVPTVAELDVSNTAANGASSLGGPVQELAIPAAEPRVHQEALSSKTPDPASAFGPEVASPDLFGSSDPIAGAIGALNNKAINPSSLKLSKDDMQVIESIVRRINSDYGALRGELHKSLTEHCDALARAGQATLIRPGERFQSEGASASATTVIDGQRYGVRLDIKSVPDLAAIDAESDNVLSAGVQELKTFIAAHGTAN